MLGSNLLRRLLLVACVVVLCSGGAARAQLGVCCHNDASCTMETFAGCNADPTNVFLGGCGTCDIAICTVACCRDDGTCLTLSQGACLAISGNPQGSATTCAPLPACPFALGSCCFANGTCTITTRIFCQNNAGGVFQGAGSAASCNDLCGPPRGACCRGAQCVFLTQSECGEHFWVGPLVTCSAAAPQCCPVDFNFSGTVSVQDIFDFLAAYFAGSFSADFNHNCALSVQDIFDFLAAYFTGC